MSRGIEAFAPAKINLTLEITGRRADGYHLLHSLVVFARDLGDGLSVSAADDLSLHVTGPMASGVPAGEDNLVLRAARLLAARRDVQPKARIVLEKHLPNGAGLGGGSSDAAAALRALARLWNVAPLSGDEALALGADLPVCLQAPVPALMSGIGETVQPVPGLPEFWLVLVNPGVVLDTARVFEVYAELYGDKDYREPRAWGDPLLLEDLQGWTSQARNALTNCAAELTDRVGAVLKWTWSQAATLDCDMSGSGSTCWGMYGNESAARDVAEAAKAMFPGHWIQVTAVATVATD